MNHAIYPCVWMNGTAAAAAAQYTRIFRGSRVLDDTPQMVTFELMGQKIAALNGGPRFEINPAISLFVTCRSTAETDRLWHALVENGSVLMPIDKYDWSERYGWLKDAFGLTWQINFDPEAPHDTLRPCLLFTAQNFGRAREAITFYTSLFKPSATGLVAPFPDDTPHAGNLMYAEFSLGRTPFIAMDGPDTPEYTFNEGVSLVVLCDTQEEIDFYWNALVRGGEPAMCGWLRDALGVWWQIVPARLVTWLQDPQRGPAVMQQLLTMRKIEIQKLLQDAGN
jgi:predicted 3-demethylubiquinone-9 3-methyltransferase (glyoxalase superfamily)